MNTRREFLKTVAGAGAVALTGSRVPLAAAQANAGAMWRSKIGLELYTVRDLLTTDFEGTLAKVAGIGYTEVEPTSYNNMSPKDFRALLDRHKLTMPSTAGDAQDPLALPPPSASIPRRISARSETALLL